MVSNPFSRQAAFRSALMMTGSTYATYTAGLIASSLVARSLGPQQYGRYAYVVWMSAFLIIAYNHGLVSTGIRYISESLGAGDRTNARAVYGKVRTWYWLSVGLISVAFFAAVFALRPSGWENTLWPFALAVSLSAIAKSEFLFTASMAKGYGQYSVEARTTSIMSVVSVLGTVVLYMCGATLRAYVVFFVVQGVMHSVFGHAVMRGLRISPSHDAIENDLGRRIRVHLFWSALLSISVAFGGKSIETYLLNETAGAESVAFFAVASALSRGGFDVLSTGLNAILLPALAHGFGSGSQERVNRITAFSVRYAHFLGMLLVGVGVLWAAPIVHTLYGGRFLPAARLLQVLAVVGGLTMSNGVFGAMLTTTDNQRVRALVIGFSVGINVVTAIVLVPRFGINGAVASTAFSSLLVFALVIGCVIKLLRIRLPVRDSLLISVAAALGMMPAIGLLLINHSTPMKWLSGVVFVLAYLVATLGLRIWTVEDLDTLNGLGERLPLVARLVDVLRPWFRAG